MLTVNKCPKSGVKWGLQNFFDQLVLSLFVLNCPVRDISARCDEIRLIWTRDPVPLQQLLTGVMHGAYRDDLAACPPTEKILAPKKCNWHYSWWINVADKIEIPTHHRLSPKTASFHSTPFRVSQFIFIALNRFQCTLGAVTLLICDGKLWMVCLTWMVGLLL